LLYKTLTSNELRNDGRVIDLKDFLEEFFYVDMDDLDNKPLPTFEEVLTMVDMSLARQDDFSSNLNYERLSGIRDKLIYSIAKILEICLRNSGGLHRRFVDNLFALDRRIWSKASFVNLNYDLLLDNALIRLYENKHLDLEYSIDFRNFVEHQEHNNLERHDLIDNPEPWEIPRPNRSILLLKPHGSLNWLYCPNCNTVKTTKTEKGALTVWTERAVCEIDHSRQKTLLVPPTWEKVYDNAHLMRISQKTYEVLKKANRVFFIDYSFADVDIELKYLFKRALYESNPIRRPKITVISREQKDDKRIKELKTRYTMFLGNDISFDLQGFEYFAEHVGEFAK
jgi:hypothetical protein